MASLDAALRGRRLIAEIPDEGVGDWIAVCEVMIQEGIRAWAFPRMQWGILPDVLKLYGRRAAVGACGVRTPEDVREARSLGVRFLTSPIATPFLAPAAEETPIALGAMTPTEVHDAIAWGAPAVQVTAAEFVGVSYADRMARMFAPTPILAQGRLSRMEVETALDGQVSAVVLGEEALFPDLRTAPYAAPADDLDTLRMRCQLFGDLDA